MNEQDVLTQVPLPGSDYRGEFLTMADLPDNITLDMRGKLFQVSKERLLVLPECILLGIISSMTVTPFGTSSNDRDSDVMSVDFDPNCFQYVIDTLISVKKDLPPLSIKHFKSLQEPAHEMSENFSNSTRSSDNSVGEHEESAGDVDGFLPWLQSSTDEIPKLLKCRPALIVLREDLEYYVLGDYALPDEEQLALKSQVGDIIAESDSELLVFNGLKNCNTVNTPEYHLKQMLVLAGLDPAQKWGYRERLPRTARVLSLLLSRVLVPNSPETQENIHALQKLLLFWRKPAKKCWWDKFDIPLERFSCNFIKKTALDENNLKPNLEKVRVHARKVWTLELSIIGLEE